MSRDGCHYGISLTYRFLHREDHLSLKALTRLLLGLELPKSHFVRCSNWESHALSNSQASIVIVVM